MVAWAYLATKNNANAYSNTWKKRFTNTYSSQHVTAPQTPRCCWLPWNVVKSPAFVFAMPRCRNQSGPSSNGPCGSLVGRLSQGKFFFRWCHTLCELSTSILRGTHATDWEYLADSSMVWIYEWCAQLQHFEWNHLLHVAQQKVFVTRRHRDSVRILLVEWRILVQCHVFEFNSHITVFNAKRLDSIMFHHVSIFFFRACFMVSWFLGSRRAEVILLFLYLLFLVSTILIRRLLDAEDVLWVFWWCHLVLWFFYPAGPHFGVASAFGLKFQHCRSVHFVILVGSVDVRRVYLQLEKG